VLKIDRYIMLYFSIGMLPVMLLLLALFSFLPLTDALRDVGKGSFDLLDALKLVTVTTPGRVVDLLPVTALLGGLAGLGVLANHGELVVIQAAGWSKPRIAQPITLVALGLVGLVLVLQVYVVPASEREAIRIRSKTLQNTKVDVTNLYLIAHVSP